MTTLTPTDENPQGQWTVDEDGTLRYGDQRMAHNLVRCGLLPEHPESGPNYLTDPAYDALVDLVSARPAPAPTAEQWILIGGSNVYSPVGPFPSYGDAEDHYKANQTQGDGWLAQPTIVRLLRPCALSARTDTEDPAAERRLCSKSFAAHPENHTVSVAEGWGRCTACGEVLNVSGKRLPQHDRPTVEDPSTGTEDGTDLPSCVRRDDGRLEEITPLELAARIESHRRGDPPIDLAQLKITEITEDSTDG